MRKYAKGFTLVELLLVMVIMSVIIMMGTAYMTQRAENLRSDRAALQMQYILNAGLAYYVANGAWPDTANNWSFLTTSTSTALQPNFLPPQPIPGPYGLTDLSPIYPYYFIGHWTDVLGGVVPANTFQVGLYVGTTPQQQARGQELAGKLPNAYYSSTGFVYAYVAIPGQNLNNAMAVNFVGLYHHGACVPVPVCPNTTASGGVTTTPQVFVVPVSVSGVNDPSSNNIYPISSFTAYATAMGETPPACNSGTADDCTPINGNAPASGEYWRVCLQVITEKGEVAVTRTDKWGNDVTLAAFTRCAISNEPAGSDFTVYTH